MKSVKFTVLLLMMLTSMLNAEFKDGKYLPDHSKVQFAGNQGVISVGAGYYIYKNRWDIDLMYSYVPKDVAGTELNIITLKNSIFSKSLRIRNKIKVRGLLSLSTIYTNADNTYVKWPDRYPKGYYRPNAFRNQIAAGVIIENISKKSLFNNKAAIYFEAGMLDIDIYHYFKTQNKELHEVINLSLGMRFKLNPPV